MMSTGYSRLVQNINFIAGRRVKDFDKKQNEIKTCLEWKINPTIIKFV